MILFRYCGTVQIFVWWHFLKVILFKALKSSFSKHQVAASRVLTEITRLVLACWQWAWEMKILMVSLQLTLWNLFCWHLSHILGDHHAEEKQSNSFRHGLLLNYNGFKGLISPCCSEIFLSILVTGLQMAFGAHPPSSTCQPGVSPSALGSIAGARGRQTRAVQPGQTPLRSRDQWWYTSMGSSDAKCYFWF